MIYHLLQTLYSCVTCQVKVTTYIQIQYWQDWSVIWKLLPCFHNVFGISKNVPILKFCSRIQVFSKSCWRFQISKYDFASDALSALQPSLIQQSHMSCFFPCGNWWAHLATLSGHNGPQPVNAQIMHFPLSLQGYLQRVCSLYLSLSIHEKIIARLSSMCLMF